MTAAFRSKAVAAFREQGGMYPWDRIPVATVVGMVAEGMTEPEILDDYLQLTPEDVREALS